MIFVRSGGILASIVVLITLLVGCNGSSGGGSAFGGGDGGQGLGSGTSASITANVYFPDPTSLNLATFVTTDGQRISYFGTKDASGLPTAITSAIATLLDPQDAMQQVSVTLTYDTQGRPLSADVAGRGSATFDYVAADRIVVTLRSPDGVVLTTADYNPVTQSFTNSSFTTGVLAAIARQNMGLSLAAGAATTSATPSSLDPIIASVTGQVQVSCGEEGSPIDGAVVKVTYSYADSAPVIDIPVIRVPGTVGLYEYVFPYRTNKQVVPSDLQAFAHKLAPELAAINNVATSSGFNTFMRQLLPELIAAGAVAGGPPGAVLAAVIGGAFAYGSTVANTVVQSPDIIQKAADSLNLMQTAAGTLSFDTSYRGHRLPSHSFETRTVVGQPPVEFIIPAGQCVTVQFSQAHYTRIAPGHASITVTRNPVLKTIGANVPYFTSPGTAVAGKDYQTVIGAVFFNPGEESKDFSVQLLSEATDQSTVNLTLVMLRQTQGLDISVAQC